MVLLALGKPGAFSFLGVTIGRFGMAEYTISSMHILILVDQNLHTAGGAQASVRLQRKYLQKLGHTVSICSPSPPSSGYLPPEITIPSLVADRENGYRVVLPGRKAAQSVERQLQQLPPVDIVHIQADFGAAVLGVCVARRNKIPCVVTYHTNVEAGVRASIDIVQQHIAKGLVAHYGRHYLGSSFYAMYDSWRYLARLGQYADLRLAPTKHFAKLLQQKGTPAPIVVMSNGVDDDVVSAIKPVVPAAPRIIWAGRMSGEKRPLEFLQAVQQSGITAKVDMYGSGALLAKVRRAVATLGLGHQVQVHGHIAHSELLQQMAEASVLVQSSYGFDTQGMTIIEAATLGLQVVVSDPKLVEGVADRCIATDDQSVAALAAALRQAEQKCAAEVPGAARKKRTTHLQSALTARMVQLYGKLI